MKKNPMKIKLLLCFFLILLPMNHSYAFEGNRSGVILGVGFGFNESSLTTKSATGSLIENTNGFASLVRVGYGFNEQFNLFMERCDSLFYLDDNNNAVLWDSSLSGLGITYYLLKEPDSPYFTVSYGYGEQLATKEEKYDKYHGKAYKFGLGYQTAGNIAIELAAVRKELKSGSTYIVVESVLLTVNLVLF